MTHEYINELLERELEICYSDNHSDVIWKGFVKTKQELEKVVLEKLKMENKKFECPDGKCFLDLIYPNSDANLACDCYCYFKEGKEGEKHLKSFIERYKDKWEQLNSKKNN